MIRITKSGSGRSQEEPENTTDEAITPTTASTSVTLLTRSGVTRGARYDLAPATALMATIAQAEHMPWLYSDELWVTEITHADISD